MFCACVKSRGEVEPVDNDPDITGILNKLGYSTSLIKKRVQIYQNSSDGGSLVYREKSKEKIDLIVNGSRGEGIGICFDSDVDKLFVQRSVKCLENEQDLTASDTETIHFYLDTYNVPCGYTKLVLIDGQLKSANENFTKRLNEALVNINGKLYLQNNHLFTEALSRNVIWKRTGWLSRNLNIHKKRNGPSKPYIVRIPYTTIHVAVDNVLAFPCSCPRLVTNWIQRKRTHNWPPNELIQRVKDLDVLVVPVGVEGSQDETLQWRISFSLVELELVWSFNDSQIKVYALLKMLAKSHLRVICKKITSYVMKNVFCWLSEGTDMSEFIPKNIISMLKMALACLHKCITERSIPNYMMPERDHYEGISEKQRTRLLKKLDALVEDTRIFLKCPLIKYLLTLKHNEREMFIKEREVGEQLVLSILSLESETLLNVLKKLFEADTKKDVHNVFITEVLALRRREDPFGFFNHIKDMTDKALIETFLRNFTWTKICSSII